MRATSWSLFWQACTRIFGARPRLVWTRHFLATTAPRARRATGERDGPLGLGRSIRASSPTPSPIAWTTGTSNARWRRTSIFSLGELPLLRVVKKNASVLKNILSWVDWAANDKDPKTGKSLVAGVPLLLIDDEADHSSVDTKGVPIDEDGKPVDDYNPAMINRCIRKLLYSIQAVRICRIHCDALREHLHLRRGVG